MSKKVLIFDDHEIITQVLSRFLRQKGFKTTEAHTQNEFLSALSENKFDTIISDASITDMSYLKLNSQGAQVVFISGHLTQDCIEGHEIPGSAFLKKPFSLNTIVNLIRSAHAKEHSKVLVVDDQDSLRQMLVEYLKSKGFEIKEAKNGREAVKLAIEFPFDNILMDVRMPELDGVLALQEMQKAGVKAPVILMSGYGDVSSIEDAHALGARHFLPKPFKLETASGILEDKLG